MQRAHLSSEPAVAMTRSPKALPSWPAPATGRGRTTGRSTSGPPKPAISMARMAGATAALVPTGSVRCVDTRLLRLAFALVFALEERLHRQLDAALLVGLEHLDPDD